MPSYRNFVGICDMRTACGGDVPPTVFTAEAVVDTEDQLHSVVISIQTPSADRIVTLSLSQQADEYTVLDVTLGQVFQEGANAGATIGRLQLMTDGDGAAQVRIGNLDGDQTTFYAIYNTQVVELPIEDIEPQPATFDSVDSLGTLTVNDESVFTYDDLVALLVNYNDPENGAGPFLQISGFTGSANMTLNDVPCDGSETIGPGDTVKFTPDNGIDIGPGVNILFVLLHNGYGTESSPTSAQFTATVAPEGD